MAVEPQASDVIYSRSAAFALSLPSLKWRHHFFVERAAPVDGGDQFQATESLSRAGRSRQRQRFALLET